MGRTASSSTIGYFYPPSVLRPTPTAPLPPAPMDIGLLSADQQHIVAYVLASLERLVRTTQPDAWQLNFATLGFHANPAPNAAEKWTLETTQPVTEYSLQRPFPAVDVANDITRLDRAIGNIAKQIQSITTSGQLRPPYGHIVWHGDLVSVDGELSWDTERYSYEASAECRRLASFNLFFHRPRP